MGASVTQGTRIRVDALLVKRGLVDSRTQAAAAVLAGEVYVSGTRAAKPGQLVTMDALVEVRSRRRRFVGRGGEKLDHALGLFQIAVAGGTAVDVGASTGGFTDCLLQHGATRVVAIDVGTGQLDWRLRTDPRVVSLEKRDIRTTTVEDVGGAVDIVTIDVAFISLVKVLPAVMTLVRSHGDIVALVKPQFEVGPKLARRGVVRDVMVHRAVLSRVLEHASAMGLVPIAATYSPLAGPEGNLEFFVHLRREGQPVAIDVEAVVAQAHAKVPRRGIRPRRAGDPSAAGTVVG
ncbi:MAG TPA: TlyA family RNA methyltransferase [bacterium]|nr:TlyA family RNA methyltransferase [bacterium]